MLEDLADLRCLHGLTTNAEVRAFLEQEIRKLASPSSPDDAPAVERAGWTLPAQPSPSTSAPAGAPAAAPAKKGAATAAGKEAAAADDSEGGDSEDGAASDPDEVIVQQERLEERMRRLRVSRGPSDDATLKATFKLLDCLIGQYKLNMTDRVLSEVKTVCKERGSDWYVKWIQSLAFCRWKQHNYKEALRLFHEQEGIVGASAALCENIGHTYSSMGDLTRAEEYFVRSIELLKHGSFGNKGGVYMGLGLVKDRLGKTREALPILEQALEHYLQERTRGHQVVDSSIIAKAHTSVGKAQEKLGELTQAAHHFAEALRIFRATVGESSPLTAGALATYGKLRMKQGPAHHKEAAVLLTKALRIEVAVDSFHLQTAWELLQALKDHGMQGLSQGAGTAEDAGGSEGACEGGQSAGGGAQGGGGQGAGEGGNGLGSLKAAFGGYVPLVTLARKRITKQHEEDDVGTLAVFYKTAGELCCLAQEYALGEELLCEALRLLRKVADFDCSSLIEGCEQMIAIASSNQAKEPPQPPRVLDVTQGASPDLD